MKKFLTAHLFVVCLAVLWQHEPRVWGPLSFAHHAERAIIDPFEVQFDEGIAMPFVHDPRSIATSDNGWYILDAGNYRVLEVNHEGRVQTVFGGEGQGPGELLRPEELRRVTYANMRETQDTEEEIWVMDPGNNRIARFDANGSVLGHHTSLRHPGSFCVHPDQFAVAASPSTGRVIDVYHLDGTYDTSLGTVDTLTVDGYRGSLEQAIRSENQIYLECLDDERVAAIYRNRPLVRIFNRTGTVEQEWTLAGGLLDDMLEHRDRAIRMMLGEQGGQGYPTMPITWGGSAVLPDERLLIALQTGAFHVLDPDTGAQTSFTYQDVFSMNEGDDVHNLWYVGVSGGGQLLAADPQTDELFRVELVE